MDHKDSWKNLELSKEQLKLNLKELSSPFSYPQHWNIFLEYVKQYDVTSVLDLGCGVGSYYQLLQNHFPKVKYVGMDYSKEAIDLAKSHWGYSKFYQKDLWDLTQDDLKSYDLIHMGALLDVLPNGDEALDYILSLSPKSILVGRMEFTSSKSGVDHTYKAYDISTTYKYLHNLDQVLTIIKNNNYSYSLMGDKQKTLYIVK